MSNNTSNEETLNFNFSSMGQESTAEGTKPKQKKAEKQGALGAFASKIKGLANPSKVGEIVKTIAKGTKFAIIPNYKGGGLGQLEVEKVAEGKKETWGNTAKRASNAVNKRLPKVLSTGNLLGGGIAIAAGAGVAGGMHYLINNNPVSYEKFFGAISTKIDSFLGKEGFSGPMLKKLVPAVAALLISYLTLMLVTELVSDKTKGSVLTGKLDEAIETLATKVKNKITGKGKKEGAATEGLENVNSEHVNSTAQDVLRNDLYMDGKLEEISSQVAFQGEFNQQVKDRISTQQSSTRDTHV